MIDTLNYTLPHTYYDNKHIRKIFKNKLNFKVDSRYKNGSALIAHYNNYSFSLSEKQLRATGSLTKLYLGNNVENMDYNQFQDALNIFETLFEIPFDEATINRVDVSACLLMSQPVNMYLDLIIPPHDYELRQFGNKTKGFVNNNESLNFYNKMAEIKKTDAVSYRKYFNDYILRYELKLTKSLLKQLGIADLKFKSLYDPEVYQKLIKQWYDGYTKVPKLTKSFPSQLDCSSLTAYKQSHVISNIINSCDGLAMERNRIHYSKIEKSVKHRISSYLDSIYTPEPLSTGLQFELDTKIESMYWKQMDQIREIMYPYPGCN